MTNAARLPLFDQPWNKPVEKPYMRSLESAFRAFHARNPHVLDAIVAKAKELRANGHKKAGAKWVVEQIRWASGIATDSRTFRLPNAHTAFYARLAMHRAAPALDGFFRLARQNQTHPFDPATVTP